jgi:hypothetical protein
MHIARNASVIGITALVVGCTVDIPANDDGAEDDDTDGDVSGTTEPDGVAVPAVALGTVVLYPAYATATNGLPVYRPEQAILGDSWTGLYAPGTPAAVFDGHAVTSCARYFFGRTIQSGTLSVRYTHTSTPIAGDTCSGSYCGTFPGLVTFDSPDAVTWHTIGSAPATTENVYATQTWTLPRPVRYLAVCRGGGGAARDNVRVNRVYVTTPTTTRPVDDAWRPILSWESSPSADFATMKQIVAVNEAPTRVSDFAHVPVIDVIDEEHRLASDPVAVRTRRSTDPILGAPALGLCARYATGAQKDQCIEAAIGYLNRWSRVYVAQGNPIDDRHLFELVMLGDLVMQWMTVFERNQFIAMVNRMLAAEASFMDNLSNTDLRRYNNWMLASRALRVLAARVTRNSTVFAAQHDALWASVSEQYSAPNPPGFVDTNCVSPTPVPGYVSFDFQQRDAFLYHMAGLLHVVKLEALIPSMFPSTTGQRSLLLTALSATRPYVLGTLVHQDFVCTTVAFDIQRGLVGPWNPISDRLAFRYARLGWPEIKSWTTRFMTDAGYYSWFKLFATAHGEPRGT